MKHPARSDCAAPRKDWQRFTPWAGGALIALAVFLAYMPALHGGFIWDDDVYVTDNPLLTAPDGLQRIWFSAHFQSQYFPLTYTTLRIARMLWGLNPAGYHLLNVLFHAANALVVWRVLRKLQAPWPWLAAVIFALHPVHVESVAWITELKNVQSTFFYLLAILAWVRFLEGPPIGRRFLWYALAFLFFALALFSKTTACTLPVVLLLLCWLQQQPIGWRRLAQLAPFVAFGLGMGVLTIWWERHNYQEQTAFYFGWATRLLVASRSLWFYLSKLAWPVNLTFSYPRWQINPADLLQYIWALGLVALLAVLWFWRKALGRGVIGAALFFAVALAPVLGFFWLITFHYSFVADHYQYVASIGPIALFAALLSKAGKRWGAFVTSVPAAVLVVTLGILTFRQAGIYLNADTLWSDTLAKNPGSWMAHNNWGLLMAQRGETDQAIDQYQAALRIKPDCTDALVNYGVALKTLGRNEAAIEQFGAALRFNPRDPDAHNDLGVTLMDLGRVDEARQHFEAVLQHNPGDAIAWYNAGNALQRQGKNAPAIEHYTEALRLDPFNAAAHNNLGQLFMQERNFKHAEEHFSQSIRLRPKAADGWNNMAALLLEQRQSAEALPWLQRARELAPQHLGVHFNLGKALARLNKSTEAMSEFEFVLQQQPAHAPAHYELGNLDLGKGDKVSAVEHYRKAVLLDTNFAEAHYQLATVLGSRGESEQAGRHYKEAIRLRPNWVEAVNNLAWLLATCPDAKIRDGRRALLLARRGLELTSTNDFEALDTLAAAYAESGNWPEAEANAQRGLELARGAGKPGFAAELEGRLRLYRAGKPYRAF